MFLTGIKLVEHDEILVIQDNNTYNDRSLVFKKWKIRFSCVVLNSYQYIRYRSERPRVETGFYVNGHELLPS